MTFDVFKKKLILKDKKLTVTAVQRLEMKMENDILE